MEHQIKTELIRGLLRLISIVKIEAHGPHPPIIGPRPSDHGPLVLAW